MIDREQCCLMADYNGWMNDKLYAPCAALGNAERRQDRGALFHSIHGTRNHLNTVNPEEKSPCVAGPGLGFGGAHGAGRR